MDLIKSGQFSYIIIYLEVDLSLIIYHLTYLTFLVNFFIINLFNQPRLNW